MIMRRIIKKYQNIFNNKKDEKNMLRCLWYRKFEKPEILHLLKKAALSIICHKCENEN